MAAPTPAPPEPPYNPVFEKLLEGAEGDELRGFVAYGLYKRAKREWARDLQQRKGRKPNDEELRDYIHHWTPSQLGNVQEGARQALAAYASSVLEYEEPRILKRALKGGFWRSVWPSMLASFLYTLLLIGAAIILARSGVDLIGILRQASGG